MFMSIVRDVPGAAVYGELAGGRVLITGLSACAGADVAEAFAEHKSRLVVQTTSACQEMTELAAVLAKPAADIKLFAGPLDDGDAAVRFAQSAVSAFGGLDSVVNLIPVRAASFDGIESVAAIEARISKIMAPAVLITRVAANRMRLTWTEGSILNVILMSPPRSARDQALAGLMRTALAALTRGEARDWSEHAIRINAIGPRLSGDMAAPGATLASEPDIAALALYLASRKGRQLSGHVFDAEGLANACC